MARHGHAWCSLQRRPGHDQRSGIGGRHSRTPRNPAGSAEKRRSSPEGRERILGLQVQPGRARG
jgi:hypothetical protein